MPNNRNIDIEARIERAVANRRVDPPFGLEAWGDIVGRAPLNGVGPPPPMFVGVHNGRVRMADVHGNFNPFAKHVVAPAPALRVPTVEDFNTILSNIEEIYGVKGLVAGGAVRDYTLGLPCKDVDIFVPISIVQWQEGVEELGWGPARRDPKPYLDVKKAPIGVGRVIINFKDLVVDVVLMGEDAPPINVRDFPLNLQMCSYGLAGFDVTQEFYDDLNNKTCTCISTTEEMVEKYRVKFKDWTTRNNLKDWTFVKPVIKQWWEK